MVTWFYNVFKKSQSSSASVLINLARGSISEQNAIDSLMAMQDPQTCESINALINDVSIQSKFPNSATVFYKLASIFECNGHMNQMQNLPQPQQQQPEIGGEQIDGEQNDRQNI